MPATKQQNRTQIIQELFELLPESEVDGQAFCYTASQMHEFFDELVRMEKIKKLRKTNLDKEAGKKPSKPLTAYNMFMKENPTWPGTSMKERSDARTQAWNALKDSEDSSLLHDLEERTKAWNLEHNLESKPKPEKPLSYAAKLTQYQEELERRLQESGCDISDVEKPVKVKKNKMPSMSQKSSPVDTLTSPESNATISSDLSTLEAQMNGMCVEDDEDDTDIQKNWIKSLGLKSNTASHFKAWIMYTNPDEYGPDEQTEISNSVLNELKQEHDYENLKKDEGAPWYKWLDNC